MEILAAASLLPTWLDGKRRTPLTALNFLAEMDRLTSPRRWKPTGRSSVKLVLLSILAPRPGISAARLAHHADGARNANDVLRFAPIAAAQDLWRKDPKMAEGPLKTNALPTRRANVHSSSLGAQFQKLCAILVDIPVVDGRS